MTTYNQPKLDFGETAEAEAAIEKRLRAERAAAFELAAVSIGIRAGELGYRLAGALGVFVDSPSIRAAGLTGLRWRGTAGELAADPRLACNADSVARALRRFVRAGFIETAVLVDDRGRKSGIEIILNMRAINAAAASCRTDHRAGKLAGLRPATSTVVGVPGAYPGAGSGADAGAQPGAGSGAASSHYIPVFPNTTVNPPPRDERANARGAGVFLDQSNADWGAIAQRLQALGLERVNVAIRAAKDARLEPPEVSAILAEYQANAGRLRSPGAILDRIRSGNWPTSIRTNAQIEAAKRTNAAEAERTAFERARGEAIRRARAQGRAIDDATADAIANEFVSRYRDELTKCIR